MRSHEPKILEVKALSHQYAKDWAVEDVSMEVCGSGIVGLLGANGAGKSTCMNIMCGVLNATRGDVLINGVSIRAEPKKAKRQIGFLPQQAPLHTELTVTEYLKHCANLRGLTGVAADQAVRRAKERCGVAHFSSRLIGALSGGYRQRVGLAQAILHEPSLVVLDEPTNGLDPNQIIAVRELIREIARDRTVLLSTHILREIDATCDEVKMLHNGRKVFDGSLSEFRNVAGTLGTIVSFGSLVDVAKLEALESIQSVDRLSDYRFRIHFRDDLNPPTELVNASVHQNWGLCELHDERPSLEQVFGHLSGRPVPRG